MSISLNGKAGLSGEMALRIEKALDVRIGRLMRMRSAYEIARARKRKRLNRAGRARCAA